jgi:hypothetical protein
MSSYTITAIEFDPGFFPRKVDIRNSRDGAKKIVGGDPKVLVFPEHDWLSILIGPKGLLGKILFVKNCNGHWGGLSQEECNIIFDLFEKKHGKEMH